MPAFTFGVEGADIGVPGSQINFGTSADGINCYGAIQSSHDEGSAVFGNPFLEGLFLVFDQGGARVGVAQAV